jgi:hypothetical protein
MNKLIALLVFFTFTAKAEWTSVSFDQSKGLEYFVDTKTIEKTMGMVTVWNMENYQYSLDGSNIRSSVNLLLIDCDNNRAKYVYSFWYDDLNGQGFSQGNYLEPDIVWKDFQSGTHFANTQRVVCSNRLN